MKNTKQIILSLLLVSMAGSVIAKEKTQANTEQKTLSSKIINHVIKGAKITGYSVITIFGALLFSTELESTLKTGPSKFSIILIPSSALLALGSKGLNKEFNIIKHAKALKDRIMKKVNQSKLSEEPKCS